MSRKSSRAKIILNSLFKEEVKELSTLDSTSTVSDIIRIIEEVKNVVAAISLHENDAEENPMYVEDAVENLNKTIESLSELSDNVLKRNLLEQ